MPSDIKQPPAAEASKLDHGVWVCCILLSPLSVCGRWGHPYSKSPALPSSQLPSVGLPPLNEGTHLEEMEVLGSYTRDLPYGCSVRSSAWPAGSYTRTNRIRNPNTEASIQTSRVQRFENRLPLEKSSPEQKRRSKPQADREGLSATQQALLDSRVKA